MKKMIIALAAGLLLIMSVPALAHDENTNGGQAGDSHLEERGGKPEGRGKSGFARARGENHDNGKKGDKHEKMEKPKMPRTIMGQIESVDAVKGIIYLKGHENNDKRVQLLVNAAGNATVFSIIKEDGAHIQTLADLVAGDHLMALVKKNKPAVGATKEQIEAARQQVFAVVIVELTHPPVPVAPATQPAVAPAL